MTRSEQREHRRALKRIGAREPDPRPVVPEPWTVERMRRKLGPNDWIDEPDTGSRWFRP